MMTPSSGIPCLHQIGRRRPALRCDCDTRRRRHCRLTQCARWPTGWSRLGFSGVPPHGCRRACAGKRDSMRWLLQTTTRPSRSTPFSAGPDHLDSRSFVLRNECRTNPRVRPDRVYLDGADVERDDRILLRGCADHRDL